MKKIFLSGLMGIMMFFALIISVTAEESWEIYIDDVLVSNGEIKTRTVDDIKVIPVKSLLEYLGYELTETEDIVTVKEGENCKNLRGCRTEISIDVKNDTIKCTNKPNGESGVQPIDTIEKGFEKWLVLKLDDELYMSPYFFGRMLDIPLKNDSYAQEKIIFLTRDYQHQLVVERGPTMLVNGEWIEFDVKPYIENNRVMVPFRAIAEAIDVKVEWDAENKKIIGYYDEKKYLEMTIGKKEMLVEGEVVEIDVAPEIKDNRTYIPVRAFAEGFGAEVRWSEANWNVGISIKPIFEQEEKLYNILSRMSILLPGEWKMMEDKTFRLSPTYGCGMEIHAEELYKKSCGDIEKDLENLGIKATGDMIICESAYNKYHAKVIPFEYIEKKETEKLNLNYLIIDKDNIFSSVTIILDENKYQQYKGIYDNIIDEALKSVYIYELKISGANCTKYDSDFEKYSWEMNPDGAKMYEIVSTEEKDGGIKLDIKWDEESLSNAETINSDSELITKTDSKIFNLDFTWNVYENGKMKALVKDKGGCPAYLLEAYVPNEKNRKEIIKLAELLQIGRGSGAKPVIYLYPEKEQEVEVKLNLDGEFSFTYPEYNNGWKVTAKHDGTIISGGEEYSYLFWEGDMSCFKPDFREGFVVKGSESAEFLRKTLSKMGLTPKEYNEFIVYWAPILQKNEYNKIYFAKEEYEKSARLKITPEPDSILRVYMVYEEANGNEVLPEQEIVPFKRKGFTVVEWGGHLVE